MVARAWLHIVYLVVPDRVNLKVKTLSRLRSLSLSLFRTTTLQHRMRAPCMVTR